MHDATPSRTAGWVAAGRQLARLLPADRRLADDPYGAAFTSPLLARSIERGALRRIGGRLIAAAGLQQWVLYLQVRTRVIDDALRAFVADGGRQVIVLGAGYDCRALRIAELAGVHIFEVDHPATQRHKREVLDRLGVRSPVRYLPWDFEANPMCELPAALAGAGHDPARPTLTIWEGVTVYLTEPAIDASLRAIAAWSAPGSRLTMTYYAASVMERPSLATRAIRAVVARVGEPWRWTWKRDELPAYLAARGFALVSDVTLVDAAREMLPRVELPGARESVASMIIVRAADNCLPTAANNGPHSR